MRLMGARDGGTLVGIITVLMVCVAAFSIAVKAQTAGNNAGCPTLSALSERANTSNIENDTEASSVP